MPTLPQTPPEKRTPLQHILIKEERSGSWLARRVGVTPTVMNRWISGQDKMPAPRRRQVADILGIRLSDF